MGVGKVGVSMGGALVRGGSGLGKRSGNPLTASFENLEAMGQWVGRALSFGFCWASIPTKTQHLMAFLSAGLSLCHCSFSQRKS